MLTDVGDDSRWDDEGREEGRVCKECKSSADQGWREGFLSLSQQRGVLGKRNKGLCVVLGRVLTLGSLAVDEKEVRLHTEA